MNTIEQVTEQYSQSHEHNTTSYWPVQPITWTQYNKLLNSTTNHMNTIEQEKKKERKKNKQHINHAYLQFFIQHKIVKNITIFTEQKKKCWNKK